MLGVVEVDSDDELSCVRWETEVQGLVKLIQKFQRHLQCSYGEHAVVALTYSSKSS